MLRIGIDLERIERFSFYGRPDRQAFYRRVYTPAEQAAFGLDAVQLALCFTAKEAVSKALGTGLTLGEPGSVSCLDIEISCLSGSIQPKVSLSGRAALVAHQLSLTEMVACWYHDRGFACACAIATSSSHQEIANLPTTLYRLLQMANLKTKEKWYERSEHG
jgi:phosphopantetheine--protein transferase-like protein